MPDHPPKEKTELTTATGAEAGSTAAKATKVDSVSPAPGQTAPPQIPDHQLLRCIGRGSYGEVWLARNVIGTYRAVKIVYRRDFQSDRPYEREFEGIQKFEPISRSHEGLVDILHVGRNDPAGYFYYVMELADAVTGQQIDPGAYEPKSLRREIHERGRIPLAECVSISLTLAGGLGYLHEQGLVHRDIKPANIIFVKGTPKLADIGLVCGTEGTISYVGTEGFIPPEGPGTPQADLYSLGKVLYEMSTGKDRQEFPELPTELGVDAEGEGLLEFNEVVLKACAGQAHKRYQIAQEMEAELALLQRGQSVKRQRTKQQRKGVAKITGLAAALAVAVFALLPIVKLELSTRKGLPTQSKSIAVLPFINMSADKENEYFSDGISDEILMALSKVSGLKVASRTSAFAFKGKSGDIQKIGQQLHVGAVLEGSVTKMGSKLHIRAQLSNVADGFHLWTESYDREMTIDDLIGIQSDVALQVAAALRVKLAATEEEQIKKRPTENLEAYKDYLQARYDLNKASREGVEEAIQGALRATALDADFAAAWALLANAYSRMDRYHDPGKDWGTKAFAAVENAFQRDPRLPEAYVVRGSIFFSPAKSWDWSQGIVDERRALELNPGVEDAHESIAYIYWHLGLLDEAIAEAQLALQNNAQNNRAHVLMAFALICSGKPAEALPHVKQLPASYTDWIHGWLEGLCLFYLGRTNEASQALEKRYHPEQADSVVIPSLQAMIAAAAGRHDEALDKIRDVAAGATGAAHYHHAAYHIGASYALMKEKKLALEWLKRSASSGWPCYRYFELDPTLENLHRDPEFISFLAKEKADWEKRKAALFPGSRSEKRTQRIAGAANAN